MSFSHQNHSLSLGIIKDSTYVQFTIEIVSYSLQFMIHARLLLHPAGFPLIFTHFRPTGWRNRGNGRWFEYFQDRVRFWNWDAFIFISSSGLLSLVSLGKRKNIGIGIDWSIVNDIAQYYWVAHSHSFFWEEKNKWDAYIFHRSIVLVLAPVLLNWLNRMPT